MHMHLSGVHVEFHGRLINIFNSYNLSYRLAALTDLHDRYLCAYTCVKLDVSVAKAKKPMKYAAPDERIRMSE